MILRRCLSQIASNAPNALEVSGQRIATGMEALLSNTKSETLQQATLYYSRGGKYIRPTLNLLLAQSINLTLLRQQRVLSLDEEMVMAEQRRLAEIVEMIHAASLLHDDVIDGAEERRGKVSANLHFGNRISILSGDYLLAQASVALAQMGRLPVVELLAEVIKDLVAGEFMQLEEGEARFHLHHYLEKSFLKTGSLLAKSMQATAMLAEAGEAIERAAFEYGKAVGVAFQLIDDCLDYEGTSTEVGKPVGADLKAGLLTAPFLLSLEAAPQLVQLDPIQEHTSIMETVIQVGGVQRTRAMAAALMEEADAGLRSCLDPSPSLTSLLSMASRLVHRRR